MNYPKLIVSNQKEESISIQRVKERMEPVYETGTCTYQYQTFLTFTMDVKAGYVMI